MSLASGTTVADLLAADGYDTPFSRVEPEVWVEHVRGWARRLGITSGTSVYEVGCGAGAFLAPLNELGATLGGCDLAPALIELAQRALPDAALTVTEAASVEPTPRYDVVVANVVFPYFPDLDYARRTLERMVAKARHSVAVIDVPDADRRDEELVRRASLFGDAATYQERYDGLAHLAYQRSWIEDTLRALGAADIWIDQVTLAGYANASTRFCVVATLPDAPPGGEAPPAQR